MNHQGETMTGAPATVPIRMPLPTPGLYAAAGVDPDRALSDPEPSLNTANRCSRLSDRPSSVVRMSEATATPANEAAVVPTEDDGLVLLPSTLSPSRASDFMSCPLKYRFRVVDRIPEPP